MGYNTLNYITEGGDELVIGGTLTVKEGATVTGITETAAAASVSALGGIKAATKGAGDTVECKIDGTSKKLYVPTYPVLPASENQADSTASTIADLKTDFNALLLKLKTAGLMTADS